MKEVTYEDWKKNPTPIMMWVWNSDVVDKVQAKVVYFINADVSSPVVIETLFNHIIQYEHCAEIEKQKQRRMTNKELSRWLREKPTRECKCTSANYIYSVLTYEEDCENEEVHKDVVIREDDGEWREPLVEVEE